MIFASKPVDYNSYALCKTQRCLWQQMTWHLQLQFMCSAWSTTFSCRPSTETLSFPTHAPLQRQREVGNIVGRASGLQLHVHCLKHSNRLLSCNYNSCTPCRTQHHLFSTLQNRIALQLMSSAMAEYKHYERDSNSRAHTGRNSFCSPKFIPFLHSNSHAPIRSATA